MNFAPWEFCLSTPAGAARFRVSLHGAGHYFTANNKQRNNMTKTATAIGDKVTDGGNEQISMTRPYRFAVEITGDADLLFHRWNCEGVAEKAAAAKGSKAKKSDDIESYVYRNDAGQICIPGEYLRQAIIAAAKYKQDPRSPRKSAMDITKAGVLALTDMATIGTDKWDYEHKARVQIQRNGVTRVRPAMKKGWKASFFFLVNLPEYIGVEMVRALLVDAGRLIGLADFRPTYGRFSVTRFEVLDD